MAVVSVVNESVSDLWGREKFDLKRLLEVKIWLLILSVSAGRRTRRSCGGGGFLLWNLIDLFDSLRGVIRDGEMERLTTGIWKGAGCKC